MQTEVIQKMAESRLAATGIGLTMEVMPFMIPGKKSKDIGITSNLTAVW